MDWTKPEPRPVKTDSAEVWPLVIRDIATLAYSEHGIYCSPTLGTACMARDRMGREKYQLGLQVENGRSPLNDLRDEALDAVAYSRQQYERTKDPEDWDLHLDCVRLAARVVERIIHATTP